MIRVQEDVFDVGAEINAFSEKNAGSGAIATFIGQVRDYSHSGNATVAVSELHLEHYPGMTEKELTRITTEAAQRWDLEDTQIIHRYGTMAPGEAIVLVCTASAHRGDAFAACEFIMDWLKTQAPFWKQESSPDGASWVDARASDEDRARRWSKSR